MSWTVRDRFSLTQTVTSSDVKYRSAFRLHGDLDATTATRLVMIAGDVAKF